MYANHLINETSPYLLQHAHNPVNWYPWGNEALTLAKNENKIILLSIGYAACHWCHVMEKESFENDETAKLMNENFINIKIDREERPDLDSIYMDVVQTITGSGGWPLHVFLTPHQKPFFGGTYFPPKRLYGRLSWKEVLQNIIKAFKEKKDEIESQAEQLTQHLFTANNFLTNQNISNAGFDFFTTEALNTITKNILQQADVLDGGFGNAPKFPQTLLLQFLLRQFHNTQDKDALNHVLLSLNKMINGGIYDHIGGGFARYSTDAHWLAPHFEKMLYDNALMIIILSEAYQLTANHLFKEIIEQTLAFIEREMLQENGGFYCALDADSEGEEGKYYTWSKEEVEQILQQNATIFCSFYDITKNGNWEQTNILRIKKSITAFAEEHKMLEKDLQKILTSCKEKLLKQREKRIKPNLDDKMLLGWNALMITAYCKAYAATSNEQYKQVAIQQIQFLENHFKTQEQWKHTYKNGIPKINAFLDDYAYLIEAYIHLQEITANEIFLYAAQNLTDYVLEFFSSDNDLLYYTHQAQTDNLIRKIEIYDGALPSANAVIAKSMLYLGIIFEKKEWKLKAEKMLQTLLPTATKHPTSFAAWLIILQELVFGTQEIVLCGENILDDLPLLLQKYIPNKVLQISTTEKNNFSLLKNRFENKKNTFYLCRNYSCKKPLYNINEFLAIV